MTQTKTPLISVEEALAHVLALAPDLGVEEIALADGLGRYMAQSVEAMRDQPPFNASAMDGYALTEPPILGARYRVVAEAAAGKAFTGTLQKGEACRISTGAPVPHDAIHVIMQENVTREADEIVITDVGIGRNIRAQGQDFRKGQTIGPRRLRPVDLALLAAMNVPRIRVKRRPKLAIISTGNELVMPGETPRPDQIIVSNAFAIKGLAESLGADVRILPIAKDEEAPLRAVFEMARGADVIVTSGGASVGDHDLVAPVVRSLGIEAAFWKIALRPGKPLMAGKLFGAAFLGLPGNPVSAVVCAELFLLPLLRKALGDANPQPRFAKAKLGQALPENGTRSHYMRAHVDETGVITPFDAQDSSLLRSLCEANALLLREVNAPAASIGDDVKYIAL